eukprot:m.38046 g.38046  ORF g.38046 m.38046 type:complete len:208 (+) comp11148_c1_seq1:502-1125(+)
MEVADDEAAGGGYTATADIGASSKADESVDQATDGAVEELDRAPAAELPDAADLVAVLVQQYIPFLSLDASPSLRAEVEGVSEDVEDILARLDEFGGVVSLIQSQSQTVLDKCVPALAACGDQLEELFHRIDRLEVFLEVVRRHVAFAEEKVAAEEASSKPLRGLFSQAKNTLLKRKTPSAAQLPPLQPMETNTFFDVTCNPTPSGP